MSDSAPDAARLAFLTLRHFSPDAVRLLRANFDHGATAKELKRRCARGEMADQIALAIDYMAAHPAAGRVGKWDGGWNWSWAEEPPAPNEEVA